MGIKVMTPKEFFSSINGSDYDEVEDISEEYSMWVTTGKEFTPAIKMKLKKTLPSGVYRISQDPRTGEVIINPSKVSTDEIYTFDNSITDKILKETEDFWSREDLYKKYNLTHKRGILLEGPAGNSKTSTINLLIDQLVKKKDGLIFLATNIRDFVTTVDALSSTVRKIEPNRPIITIIEDIDQIIEQTGTDGDLLDFLDGKKSIDHHLVIMTSNNTSNLSEALLRPSRIDMRFVLETPGKEIRREYLVKKGVPENDVDEYAEKTEGMSFAQLKEVFVSTSILGKDIDSTVEQIMNPLSSKNYLIKSDNSIGI